MSTKRKMSLSIVQPDKKQTLSIDLCTKMIEIKAYEEGMEGNVIARDLKLKSNNAKRMIK